MSNTIDCDVLIVGAGSSGCVLASRLSERPGLKVLLVEAGDDHGVSEPPEILNLYPLSYYDPRHLWSGMSATWSDGQKCIPFPQGRGVGGSSSVMGMWALRGLPQDYDEWQLMGASGWTWSSVLPYFRKLETDLDFDDLSMHGTDGLVTIRRQARTDWPPFTSAVAASASRLGYGLRLDINGVFEDGVYPVPISATFDGRVSAARAYLSAEVRRRSNLRIEANAVCSGLRLNGCRVEGAEFYGRRGRFAVLARRTIVAAGTINTPAILMASGIGPAKELSVHGINTRCDLPGVGRNLQNHVGITIGAHMPPNDVPSSLKSSAAFASLRASSDLGGVCDLYLSILNRTSWTYFGSRIGAINAVLHKPYSRGRVRLCRTKEQLIPQADFSFFHDDRDLPRLAKAVQLAAQILSSPEVLSQTRGQGLLRLSGLLRRIMVRTPINRGLDALSGTIARLFPPLELRLIEAVMGAQPKDILERLEVEGHEFLKPFATGLFHPVGTCRMGDITDPATVVGPDCRVRGMDGLSVVDASVMPTIPRANTNLPTIMIAEKVSAEFGI